MASIPDLLKVRSRLLQATRHFFLSRNYLEVETPVRIQAPALEDYIDAEESGSYYLRTSPELHMKRLLACGTERIFQTGPCFRKGEKGTLHNPEFTMLEWYCTGSDYMDVLEETKQLLCFTAKEVTGSTIIRHRGLTVDLNSEWQIYSVSEIYKLLAGWDPVLNFEADRFDLDMIEKIEPYFMKTVPCVLKDYPEQVAALARRSNKNASTAERWEVYVCGVELANAFGELTDPAEQKERFLECARKRKNNGRKVYPVDEAFIKALEKGIPECSGVALGFDRWMMLLSGEPSIEKVRIFQE